MTADNPVMLVMIAEEGMNTREAEICVSEWLTGIMAISVHDDEIPLLTMTRVNALALADAIRAHYGIRDGMDADCEFCGKPAKVTTRDELPCHHCGEMP